MRILDEDSNKSINNVLLLLTYQEACELRDDLGRLISSGKNNNHSHISDMEFKHELTLSLYNESDIAGFQERVKKLITEEK